MSRTPPPIYEEILKAELTPLETLLDEVDYFSPEESNHGSVLQENIVYRTTDGKTYELRQYAYKALSDGDLDEIGSGLYSFRPDTERIYLIKAETILPDGRVQAVPEEGILLQTPKSDRDSMIFSGRKQLRIIFPQVSLGSVTYCIVLIETDESRIPGHFTDRYSWARGWQTHLKRVVVNLPAAERERLNVVTFGSGVPEVEETELPDERVKLEWVKQKLPVRYSEYCDGPILQTGPFVVMSTLSSWDEFARWYAGRMQESSEVTEAVRAVAGEWAGDADSEDEIIHNLAFRVANDIRYVSLEFRVGGLVPQQASRVLENRFGDCKDKSNFLRLLLKEHGIKSRFVLINSDHAGLVEKRCPHYAYFDHAILMIEKSDGERIFCDPTVKYGSAGLLHPNIANRPAFVIDDESLTGRWIDMPNASGGRLHYGWDLALSESGELSGWFTIEAEDYYGASMSKRFESTNRDTLKNDVERYLGYFYGTSRVMDFSIEQATAQAPRFFLKAYFVRDAAGEADRSVSWPDVKWLFPRLGEKKEVQREAFTWTKDISLSLDIAIPASVAVGALPDDWAVETPGYQARGGWKKTASGLRADLRFDVTESRYGPPAFAKLYTAVDASSLWTEKLVILGGPEETESAAQAAAPAEELGKEFVLLSTGGGQIELIDHLYPLNTKPKLRRLALEKTQAWFPKDAATQYECALRLAWLAYSENQYAETVGMVDEAVRDFGSAVDEHLIGWADYLKAMALEEIDRKEEAQAIFRQLADDPEMNEFRRGYAAYQYGRMMAQEDPAAAVPYYFKAYTFDSQGEQWMLDKSLAFLKEHAAVEEMADYLSKLRVEKSDKAGSMVQWLAAIAQEDSVKLDGLKFSAWIYEVLQGLDFLDAVLDPQLVHELKLLNENYSHFVKCQQDLLAHLEAASYGVWKGEPAKERGFDDYTKDIDQAIEDDDIDQSCYLALARLCFFSIEVEFPAWMWDAARMVDYLYRNGQSELLPLREFIFEYRNYLPPESKGAVDLEFIRAEVFEREGPKSEALNLYAELDAMGLEEIWLEALYRRWAVLLIEEGQLDRAVEVLSKTKPLIQEDEDYLPIGILGVYALFELERFDEASEWIGFLSSECARLEIDNEHAELVQYWREMELSAQLRDFHTTHTVWWGAWEKLCISLGIETLEPPAGIAFLDTSSAGEELGEAINEEDRETISAQLWQLVLSAKWHPYMACELQSVLKVLVDHYPDATSDLYALIAALDCGDYLSDEALRYSTRSDALNALLQWKNYDALLAASERFYSEETNDEYRNMYGRYGGLAAINLDRAGTDWLGRMEQEYAKPDQKSDPYVVNILSRLYRTEGEMQQELAVLQEYLTQNRSDNTSMNETLDQRLKQLQDVMEGNQKLTEALNDWMAAFEPVWVSVFPDPELGKHEAAEVSREVQQLLDSQEGLKFYQYIYLLHAARDERLPSSDREKAFFKFLGQVIDPAWDLDQSLPPLEAVSRDGRFSENMRMRCARFAVNLAYVFARTDYVNDTYIPLLKQIDPEDEIEKGMEVKAACCDRDPLSAESVASWMDRAARELQPFSGHTAYLLNLAFDELCKLGAEEHIQQQMKNAGAYRFESTAGHSSFSTQLKWRQQAARLDELKPVHTVLDQFFRELLNPGEDRCTQVEVLTYPKQPIAEQRRIFRSMLQYGVYNRTHLRFWLELNDLEYLSGRKWVDEHNLASLMDQVLAVCENDEQYSQSLDLLMRLFDSDNPECLTIYFSKTKDILLKPGMEKTRRVVLDFQYRSRIRGGDHAAALADLHTEQNLAKRQQHTQMLNALGVAADQQAMNAYLNAADTDLLLDDGLLAQTLHAYEISGNRIAYDLVKEKGEQVFREYRAAAMQSAEMHNVYFSVLLAEQIGQLSELDEHWTDLIRTKGRSDVIEFMEMRLNHMRENWAATESAARKLVQLKPSHYDSYYYLGKAQIKQGAYEEGMKSLEPFINYCKDSWYYQDALELNEWARARAAE